MEWVQYPYELHHPELGKRVCFSVEEHQQMESEGWTTEAPAVPIDPPPVKRRGKAVKDASVE